MSTSVEKFDDSDGLVAAAGERLIGVVEAAIAARGKAQIVLTGGGNGNKLLRFLAAQTGRVDWAKVHLFWGDDRYVTEDDDERNDKQAREALLDHVDIPARNVHAMPAADGEFGDDLSAAALAYEQILAANAEPGDPAPNFDIHLLGVGPEGHINSLFPGYPGCARDNAIGGRCRGFTQTAAATNHPDAAGNSAFERGLVTGVGRREGRGGRRRGRWRRPGIDSGGRRDRPRAHHLVPRFRSRQATCPVSVTAARLGRRRSHAGIPVAVE